jgi:hypothetical protein
MASTRIKNNPSPARPRKAPSAAARDTAEREVSRKSRRLTGTVRRTIVTTVFIGVILVGTIVIASQTTGPVATGDTISQTFSAGEPCATATITIAAPSDADPTKVAQTLFDALKPVPGMNVATYNLKTAALETGFCESKTSEASVRQALASTGLVAE